MPLQLSATEAAQQAGYARGVKRLCLDSGDAELGTDGELEQRALSFLETKWEAEARKRREYCTMVDVHIAHHVSPSSGEPVDYCV